MRSDAVRSIDGRLYRVALLLSPANFRREHGDEMARDFDEARGEAASAGDRAVWSLRVLMAVDLVRTVIVQWLRTGLPFIALASVLSSLALMEALATVARRATFRIPDNADQAELVGIVLLAVVAVMLIAVTIVVNLWVNPPRRIGRR